MWDERPLFNERIEAWANGPVCPALYERHRGMFHIGNVAANPDILDQDARETIQGVLDYYGPMSAQYLSDLTHMEAPWRTARGDLPSGAYCSREITHASMAEYYEALPPDESEREDG